MRNQKERDLWAGQLRIAVQEASTAGSLSALRRLASAYSIILPGSTDLEVVRTRVQQKLESLLRAAVPRRRSRRFSAALQGSTSPVCSAISASRAISGQEPQEDAAAAALT